MPPRKGSAEASTAEGLDLHEGHAAAVQVGHRHAQQLAPAVQVPDADLPQPTRGKDVAVGVGEGHIMHAAGRGCLQHFCLQLLALHHSTKEYFRVCRP